MSGHAHEHGGAAGPGSLRRLAWVLAAVLVYMVAEGVGGLASGSLALLADAGHMLADAASVGLALFAARVARRAPDRQRTYGYYRAEILAALVNGVLLLGGCAWVFYEGVERLLDPRPFHAGLAAAVGAGGLVVNLVSLRVLRPDAEAGLNERGARLHVVMDLLGSVQVLLAAAAARFLGWHWPDAAASISIGCLVLASAWRLLRECTSVLLESAPSHVDVEAVRAGILAVEGVQDVHDLHVWTIASGFVALSAHVGVAADADRREARRRLRAVLRERFGIDHLTLEVDDQPCDDEHTQV